LIFMETNELTISRESTLVVALQYAPLSTWGFFFVVAGMMACWSSRWPRFHNTWGYMVLTGVASGWSAMYLFGYIFINQHLTTIPFALVWGLLAFLWWAISGLVNPVKVLEVIENGDP